MTTSNYASLAQRILAELIDWTVSLSVLIAFVLITLGKPNIEDFLTIGLTFLIVLIWFNLILHFLKAWMISKYGAFLGKLILGIKIVDSNGKYLTFWKAFFRELGLKPISGIFLGLGFWWMAKDNERQTWHDKMLDTYVVHTQKP